MSVTLGALVIAISTEFSVLLSERYRQERAAGLDPDAALERAYASTGAAVAGLRGDRDRRLRRARALRHPHAARLRSGHRHRPDVSLLGVLIVLPAVLVLAEQGRLALPGRPRLPRLRRAKPAEHSV
jgi:hypothetical protein